MTKYYSLRVKENTYKSYIDVLKEELLPAMGCAEPISVAYAAALARKVLNNAPERVETSAGGSILKNVESVVVPNIDRLKGRLRREDRQGPT